MKEKFCARCGKETEELTESLCSDCFSERKEWVEIPERLEVSECRGCRRKKTDGWKEISFEEAIENELKKTMQVKGEVKEINISTDRELNTAVIELQGSMEGVSMKETKEVEIVTKEDTCGECKKIETGYFEAKVQIRLPEGKKEEVLKECEEILKQRRSDEAMVSGIEERENGFDIFMPSKSAAKHLTKKLAERYEVERKDSKTLKGLRDGSKAYRSTYLVRIFDEK